MLDTKDNNEAVNAGEKDNGKLRADSNWSGLSEEQRESLERWLFEENLGYMETLERARKEFGIAASLASLQRFRRRILKERAVGLMVEAEEAARDLNETTASLANLRRSAWKTLGRHFLEKTIEAGDAKELRSLGRMVSETEEREIRRARVELARRRFEFNATKAVLKLIPLLNKIKKEDQEREDAKMDAIRLEIFGTPPADIIYDYEGDCRQS